MKLMERTGVIVGSLLEAMEKGMCLLVVNNENIILRKYDVLDASGISKSESDMKEYKVE